MRGNYKSFKGKNLTVVEGMHQFYHLPGIVYYYLYLEDGFLSCGFRDNKKTIRPGVTLYSPNHGQNMAADEHNQLKNEDAEPYAR